MEIERKFNLIHEHEWTDNTVTGFVKVWCLQEDLRRWKNRYDNNGIDGLHDLSRVPCIMKYKVDTATEETNLDLRLKRFGCNRISFKLLKLQVYLSSRVICKILKIIVLTYSSVRSRTESIGDLQGVTTEGIDFLAWYRSFHWIPLKSRGYILDKGVYYLAKVIFSNVIH